MARKILIMFAFVIFFNSSAWADIQLSLNGIYTFFEKEYNKKETDGSSLRTNLFLFYKNTIFKIGPMYRYESTGENITETSIGGAIGLGETFCLEIGYGKHDYKNDKSASANADGTIILVIPGVSFPLSDAFSFRLSFPWTYKVYETSSKKKTKLTQFVPYLGIELNF